MTCQICTKGKAIYEYELEDKRKVLICKDCGEILYQVKLQYYDRLSQLCVMHDYVGMVLTKKK